ncbi:TlpA family protein disulfide reductase [Egibacter rhizosphaerae]|uniref:TlpA family protein disulfide reductase n=1 Tax=Egibacter rhizosphaerae TaxID=1670831 RepID=A0A411YDK2_9ACTN|nr:TlpA disulfide reductase family protein [Egibacter rhizosphaerae]QBI19285.1 TlpA family protein disulfide reductase [Egibacter rhizosphaerae]
MSTTSRRRKKKGGIPPIVPVGVAVVAGIGLFAVLLTSGGGDTGAVSIEGEDLPAYEQETGEDAAVGEQAPTVEGEDFDGDPVTVDYSGDEATAYLFLAHWCPACQQEAPELQELIDAGDVPDDVNVVSVATAIDRNRDNYPPDEWLDSLGWAPDVVVDDGSDSLAETFGLTVYPYWVAVDSDGVVQSRHAMLDGSQMADLFAELSGQEQASR